ncbi:MAG: hypothetical protein ACHQ2Z_03015 [Elusimicrobiota bacterium]
MAPGGATGRGGLGWAILVAALAVPGFLFYNWWSHLKAERDHSISAKASKRADGGVFQTPPPSSGRLINPMTSSSSAPAGLPPAAAAPRPIAASVMPLPAAATPAPAMKTAGTPPAAAAPAGAPPSRPAGTAPPAPVAAAVLPATGTIVLTRDPTLSPLDLVRLREEEQAEAARQWALTHATKGERPKKHNRPIESRIELQGIVAKDGVNLAMINGLTVSSGESLSVNGYPGKVKILKITASTVTLDYKGKKFKLSAD